MNIETGRPAGTISARTRRLGGITTAWCVLFAAVHFYWAAGGAAGVQDGEPATSVDASLYIAFIALLGLAGAGVAHGLSRPGSARVGQRRLRLLARAGATLLLLGVGIGVGRWIAAGGIGDDGAAGVVITGYFLLGGALFAALSRRPDIFQASRARRIRISMSDRCAR